MSQEAAIVMYKKVRLGKDLANNQQSDSAYFKQLQLFAGIIEARLPVIFFPLRY